MEYLHDIFISYPSTLNKTPYTDWVIKFEAKLREAIADNGDRHVPDIYLDHWKVEANSTYKEMLERARRSRLFLAIVSPDYQEREWAPKELDAFAQTLDDPGRLFVIASKPLPDNEIRLKALKDNTIREFFVYPGGEKEKATPLAPGSHEFEHGIYLLGLTMAKKLAEVRAGDAAKSASTASGKPGRTILLASVTDDLEKELQGVASELGQVCREQGFTILSASDYPLTGNGFRQALDDGLASADIVVQLLSGTLGKRPRDLPEGFVLAQAQAAAARPGVKLMQWRRSDLKVEAIDDPTLRDLLQGETVTASTLADFKTELVELVRTPPQAPAKREGRSGAQIFINAEQADARAAMACRDAVKDLCASAWLAPEGDPASPSIQSELNDLIIDCDPLIFVHGDAQSFWVARQIRLAIKRRAANQLPPLRGAVCNGPPPEKADLHGVVETIEFLDCRTPDGSEWRFDEVRDYLKRMTGAGC